MTNSGKIKIILLLLICLPGLLYKIPPDGSDIVYAILPGLLFGSFAIPVIFLVNATLFNTKYDPPSWNDNLFRKHKTLSWSQFFAFFFIGIGLCIIGKTYIYYDSVSEIGVTALTFGAGIMIGIYLTSYLIKIRARKT